MWIVPNQLMDGVITDEDQRLDLIKDNLMVWGEFVSARAWKNRKWNEFFQIKSNAEDFTDNYLSGIPFGLKHDPLDVENNEDKYEDLPFLAKSIFLGKYKYLYVSNMEWDLYITSENLKFPVIDFWPTPLASDYAEFGRRYVNPKRRISESIIRYLNYIHDPETQLANPRWVEQMMGLPIGWTDPYL